MSESTIDLKAKIPKSMYVPMIVSLLSLAGNLSTNTRLASCSPVSFLQFKPSSLLAAAVFVLAIVFAIQHPLMRKFYETKTQKIMALLTHLVCFFVLVYIAGWLIYMKHSRASCFPNSLSKWTLTLMAMHAFILVVNVTLNWIFLSAYCALVRKSEIGYQEMRLYHCWARFGAFVDAVEFYLPAIEAAVDLRDLTAAAREDHDRDVQTLRVKIGEYRLFYNNAVGSEAFDHYSHGKLIVLQETIARSMKNSGR
ncbi:hypothetical protein BDP27DRAFT_1419912 [Rhodocollybia butyracea]|uniref:Uncharacterized protein n=1 Tax=Rhodocollybia butyracea TaxID=206335 RepID=A0A9P5PWK8_9AGAR|nr:hypothetical protein BDP27DRAFT_1419912 [Rhodocollybia butyracea]